tara:strand:- start:76 stop:387 length:312 start_codon:yes stop_codon:yes gene_type:complete
VSRKTSAVLASATNCALPHDATVHAERAALAQLMQRARDGQISSRDLRRGVRVVSLRFSNSGALQLARPCCECERAMRQCVLVREVAWSTGAGDMLVARCDDM